MNKRTLVFANIIALIITLVINYLSNTGIFNESTMASVSSQYENLLTPAGYAFSIWSLIYLGLFAFIFYQSKALAGSKDKNDFIGTEEETVYRIGWLFVASCAMNCLWVLSWVYDYIGISVIIMLLLLIFLFRIVVNTGIGLELASFKKLVFVWWPFSLYAGWITVALFANLASYLTKLGWDGLTSHITWPILMMSLACLLFVIITWLRNMRAYALAGIWGLIAISVANWNSFHRVAQAALILAIILVISMMLHAFKTRPVLSKKQSAAN